MNLMVTGATGFLGSRVVGDAIARGHRVSVLVRPGRDLSNCAWRESATVICADVRDRDSLAACFPAVDAVIHLAADMHGVPSQQMEVAAGGTRNLLAAMQAHGVHRVVLISSLAVYGYRELPEGAMLDEHSPLESCPLDRDAYCRSKLAQEEIIRGEPSLAWTILRPGSLIGPGRLWTDRLGVRIARNLWLAIGNDALLPLCCVGNCAEAILLAIETDAAVHQVLNIIDDELPDQQTYRKAIISTTRPVPKVIPVRRAGMQTTAYAAQSIGRLLGIASKLPHVLTPASLAARFRPLRHCNERAKLVLNWHPRESWNEAISGPTL